MLYHIVYLLIFAIHGSTYYVLYHVLCYFVFAILGYMSYTIIANMFAIHQAMRISYAISYTILIDMN